jgi:hypothetical protein
VVSYYWTARRSSVSFNHTTTSINRPLQDLYQSFRKPSKILTL